MLTIFDSIGALCLGAGKTAFEFGRVYFQHSRNHVSNLLSK